MTLKDFMNGMDANGMRPTFISFVNTNANGETSKYLLNVGVSYENARANDINTIENCLMATEGMTYIPSEHYNKAVWKEGLENTLQSLKSPNAVRSEAQKDAYIHLIDNGSMKWNVAKSQVYLQGMLVSKTVITEGSYPEVKSKPLTIAKKVIAKNYLRTGQWRMFNLKNISTIKMNGDTWELE
jgi:archaellum component FlaF (FlaF/FlaG flagellin family)